MDKSSINTIFNSQFCRLVGVGRGNRRENHQNMAFLRIVINKSVKNVV